jgi:hypothetical protein
MRFCKKSAWALYCTLFFVPAAMASTTGQCGKLVQAAYSTEVCHPFHVKAATQTAAKLPPVGA